MQRKVKQAIEETAYAEGVVRIEWEHRTRHSMARFFMADGTVRTMGVANGTRNDAYKHRGWTRQFIRNASRQAKS